MSTEPLARIDLVDCPGYPGQTRLTARSCASFWAVVNLGARKRTERPGHVGQVDRTPCVGCPLGATRARDTGVLEAARAIPPRRTRILAYRGLLRPPGTPEPAQHPSRFFRPSHKARKKIHERPKAPPRTEPAQRRARASRPRRPPGAALLAGALEAIKRARGLGARRGTR